MTMPAKDVKAQPQALACDLIIPVRDGKIDFDKIKVRKLNQTMLITTLKAVFLAGAEACDRALLVKLQQAGLHVFKEPED